MKIYPSNLNHIRYTKPTNEEIQQKYNFPCSITVLNQALSTAEVFYYDGEGNEFPQGRFDIPSDYLFQKALLKTDTAPTIKGLYPLSETGIYTNLGGINATTGKFNLASFDGTTWSLIAVAIQSGKSAYEVAVANGFVGTEAEWLASLEGENKIDTWTAKTYNAGEQVIYEGKVYEANAAVLATDVPVASSVWFEKISSFNELNEYSDLTQISATINPTNAVIKPNATSPWLTYEKPLELKDINRIIFTAKTYHAGQNNLLWYQQTEPLSFTKLSEQYKVGDLQVLNKSDFPANATHLIIQTIKDLTPSPYLRIYKEKYIENIPQVSDIDFHIVKPTLFDTSKGLTNTRLDLTNGIAVSEIGESYNLHNFAKVKYGETYETTGYLISFVVYDRNYNYLGEETVTNNRTVQITKQDAYYARAAMASLMHNLTLSQYIIRNVNNKVSYPYVGEKILVKDTFVPPVEIWGDSMAAAGYWSQFLATYNTEIKSAQHNSYGGMKSSFIRDRFAELANKNGAFIIIWAGTNNYTKQKTVLEDITQMVDSLPHDNYLVLTPAIGVVGTEAASNIELENIKIVENKLKAAFGNKCINYRELFSQAYDFGKTQLAAPFTQPALNANVVIKIKNFTSIVTSNSADNAFSAWIPLQKNFLIGLTEVYDKYEYVSHVNNGDGTADVTAKLLQSNRIATGGTVENVTTSETPSGGSVATAFTYYLDVVKEADDFLMKKGFVPSSAKADGLHIGTLGAKFLAKNIAKRIKWK